MFPDRSACITTTVTYPSSEQDLISIVSNATKSKQKIKVATKSSHSIPKLVCPDDNDHVGSLVISTKNLDRILKIDTEAMRITVESGVSLKKLISEAAKSGLVLPYAPYWWGLTIGGMLGTGAHGSSLWGKGSSVHEYVVEMRIVTPGLVKDGFVKVRVLNKGDDELNAARVSLGVLGVVSQVTLELEPMFKRSITYVAKEDSDLGDQVVSFGNRHEFADVTWYPSQGKAVYRIDDRVASNTPGNGTFNYIPFRATASLVLATLRTNEEIQESTNDANGKCLVATFITSTLLTLAFGLTNNGYPIIGYQNYLQSSGACLTSIEDGLITACAWDPRIKGEFFHQTTFKIRLSLAKSFIQDVQRLVQLEPKTLCGLELYNGILIRYVKASNAYLANQEDALDFDITYYRSRDPKNPRLYEDILEEIEQLAIFKYRALPHWGKNRNIAFEGAIKKYKNADKFLRVKSLYDPLGLFSSEWTDQMLGLKNGISILMEGCALEGLCICSEDSHCAPSKGNFCRPGKVYKEARVCTRDKSRN
ncbi:hypothetical protein ACFE04_026227 [Oxalis oulophora]